MSTREVLPREGRRDRVRERDDRRFPGVDGVAGSGDGGVEPAQDRVVLEQVSQPGVVGQVVDADDLNVGARST
jgi:hypothetical protein